MKNKNDKGKEKENDNGNDAIKVTATTGQFFILFDNDIINLATQQRNWYLIVAPQSTHP